MTRALLLFFCLAFAASAHATEVKEVKTPAGFTAWLVEEHALPLVAVKIAFKNSGYAYDPKGKEGRANMTAALLMEGAGDMDARAFYEALESSAIQLDMSADEDDFLIALESLSEHKEKAFSCLGLALSKPRFDSDAMERVKGQTQTALTQQDQDPGYQAHRAWKKLAFGDHPYANPEIGTKESVGNLSGYDMRQMQKRYLTRENIVIAAVGDINEAELAVLIDKHLAGLPEKYDPDAKVEEVKLPAGEKPFMVEFDIPQTLVGFGTNGLKRSDPDYFHAYVMNQILGGGGSLTARLGKEIREKRGLAYSVFSRLDPMAHAASWQGGFATRGEQAAAAREVLIATLKDFVEKGPSEQEVADAKQYLTGSFVLSLGSNADIASFLISMQLNNLGRDYLAKRNSLVEAVTRENVHAMAKRLIDTDKLLMVMVGKPATNN